MNDLPGRLRQALKPLLPPRAFLRRDRDGATFVTNAPLFSDEALIPLLETAGFRAEMQGALLRISPGKEYLTELEQNHPDPPDFFCESLLRLRNLQPCEEALDVFAAGVRLLESSTPSDRTLYDRRVRSLAAVCLRKSLGGAYACALLLNLMN